MIAVISEKDTFLEWDKVMVLIPFWHLKVCQILVIGSMCFHSFRRHHFQCDVPFCIGNMSEASVIRQKGFNSLSVCHKCDMVVSIRPTVPDFTIPWEAGGFFLELRHRLVIVAAK
jgi:hypothetical protein